MDTSPVEEIEKEHLRKQNHTNIKILVQCADSTNLATVKEALFWIAGMCDDKEISYIAHALNSVVEFNDFNGEAV